MSNLPKNLKGIDNKVVLIILKSKAYQKYLLDILKYMISKGGVGVYVVVNKPYVSTFQWLKENGVDTDKLFFVDLITRIASEMPTLTEKCIFLSSPSNLTDLSIALDQVIGKMNFKKKFVIFESLPTLLIYNPVESILKFTHFLSTKARMLSTTCIFLTLEEETDNKTISEMGQFCDKVINVNKGDI